MNSRIKKVIELLKEYIDEETAHKIAEGIDEIYEAPRDCEPSWAHLKNILGVEVK